MDATADADHFIVAYPQALIPDGTRLRLEHPWRAHGQREVPAGQRAE